jgi:hypothetical protein
MVTLRCDAAPNRSEELEGYFARVLPEMAKLPRVHGAHLCRPETEASTIETEERRARPSANLLAEFVVMIEASLPEALDPVLPELDAGRLLAAGASKDASLEIGLYRLELIC